MRTIKAALPEIIRNQGHVLVTASIYAFFNGSINSAYAASKHALQGFFGVDRSDRDPQHARAAFRDFSQLIQQYPNSQYATDANKRLVYLKDRLAKYELSVAEYYTKRGAYVAVVNRAEQMLREFPDTKATHDVLPLMENAYKQLQLNGQADKVAKVIAANPQ